MSKAIRESIEKATKQLAKFEPDSEELLVVELRRVLETANSLAEERRSLKLSLKENQDVLAASAKELTRLVRRAKRAAEATAMAQKAVKLVEKAKKAAEVQASDKRGGSLESATKPKAARVPAAKPASPSEPKA